MSSFTDVHDEINHLGRYPSRTIGSVSFLACNPEQASDHVIDMAKARIGTHVHLANAYTVALADESESYRTVLDAPAVNFPDGKPLGWVSALKRHSPRLKQVRGPQLFLDVFDRGRARGIRHYLLGSTPEVLNLLELELHRRFPGVRIVGVESPPFRVLSADELAQQDDRVLSSGADIVWVGLGTPKQDIESERLAAALPIVAVAVGAAFDFTAGTLQEAPAWMKSVGLEWFYRLIKEPRRLWKRYVFGNLRFLKAALL